MEIQQQQALKTGTVVIIILLTFTALEFFVGVYLKLWWGGVLLLIIGALKSFFVIRDYMHIGRLFVGDKETH
jgi:hypothetical protein